MLPLHDYQKKALEFSLKHINSYQAVDMGMGKTRIGLEWSSTKKKSTLVIAPLRTIMSTWPDEVRKWTPHLSHVVLHGSGKTLRHEADIYLINYEGLDWLFGELKRIFKAKKPMPFRSMIIDEGSMVKSHATKRFKVLKHIKDLCNAGIMILSGTPAPNSLLDLWSQYYILDNGLRLGGGIGAYREEYFHTVDRQGYVWKLRDQAFADVIHEKISDITFRLQASDYLSIPPRIDNIINIELPKKVKKQIEELEKTMLMELEDDTIAVGSKVGLSMKLRQVIQGGIYTDDQGNYEVLHKEKLKVLKSLVEEANGQGILCAIQFRFELAMLKKVFPNAPVVAGGSKIEDFLEIVRAWNAGEIPLLICHPASLSHGVNLQAGSHLLVWYGLPWSLEQYLQLNKRLHRQGQLHTCIIHHLIAKGTIDERVLKALHLKLDGLNGLLDYLRETSR